MYRFNFRSTIEALGFLALAAASGLVAVSLPSCTAARAAEVAPAASPATVPSDPSRDAALKAFVQKRFRIPNFDEIKLGPMTATPIAGIFARAMTVSNDKGQTARVELFTDKEQTKLIIGQYLDLSQDPWGRTDLRPLHLDDRPMLGPADAPITIIEFADFECPFCARAFGEIETLVNTSYKGKVRLIFKNYPLNGHPWARTAAVGAECARLQNPQDFWTFARYFYSNQGKISVANVKQQSDNLAAKLGLDRQVFDACMAGTSAPQRIQQDETDANAVRVTSTPTFFVNGIPIVGLPEGKVFDFVINSELAGTAHASR
jgi:protein-disulfide isomerase